MQQPLTMRPWVALLGALAATVVAMINSDGLGASAPVPPNPLGWDVNFTAYGPADGNTVSRWPTGFTKGGNAFVGAAFDGANVWLVPSNADRIPRDCRPPYRGSRVEYDHLWQGSETKSRLPRRKKRRWRSARGTINATAGTENTSRQPGCQPECRGASTDHRRLLARPGSWDVAHGQVAPTHHTPRQSSTDVTHVALQAEGRHARTPGTQRDGEQLLRCGDVHPNPGPGPPPKAPRRELDSGKREPTALLAGSDAPTAPPGSQEEGPPAVSVAPADTHPPQHAPPPLRLAATEDEDNVASACKGRAGTPPTPPSARCD